MKLSLPVKILILAVVGLAIGLSSGLLSRNQSHKTEFAEVRSDPVGGDFTVSSSEGDIRLSDYKGKIVLLYFGYTYCPDICPTSLTLMSNAFKMLSEEEIEKVQGLFVSVDSDRDTLEQLKNYTNYFHPKILGASSNKANIDDIVKRYGAFYQKVDTGSSAGYSVDHSASTALIDQDGKIIKMLPHGMPSDQVVTEIRKYL